MPNEQKPHSFWTSIPGILTAVAALLTATGGLIVAFKQFSPPRAETPSAVTPTPARDTASVVTPTPSTSRMGPLVDGVAYLQADIYSRATNDAAGSATGNAQGSA